MKIVVFGLAISSSWGNGHATLWRGLCKSLARLGHQVTFFERDQPWYANARDWTTMPDGALVLYPSWGAIRHRAAAELADADAAIVTSYCPDALDARAQMLDAARPLRVFYDLDAPVTLERVAAGDDVPYVGERGFADYDVVLSYAGGPVLQALRDVLGARRVEPLYGHVDPDVHRPVAVEARYRADLSWLGTWAADRQQALEGIFVRPAQQRPEAKFLIGGAQYPADFPWGRNVHFVAHVPPHEHAAFLCSSRLTLNVTRAPMVRSGWCPSGRLFEAGACGATVLTDDWPGLSQFYQPGSEVLLARDAADTVAALDLDDATLRRIGAAARERTLDEHTSSHRARTLVALLEQSAQPAPQAQLAEMEDA